MIDSTHIAKGALRRGKMDTASFKDRLKEFLVLSLDRCMQAVHARSGSIFLIDEERKELVLEIAKSDKAERKLEGVRARLGERIAGRVALERKPFFVENIDNEPSLKYTPKFDHYKTKSFLSVPLECAGNLLGVINVSDKAADALFSPADLNVLTEVSNHLAIALHTLKRYSQESDQLQERLSKELERVSATIDRSNKFSSLGKLVGGIVHEINNPLDGVIRYVTLACDSIEEHSVAKEYLVESKNGLMRIAKIVRSLLDFCWSLSPKEQDRIDIHQTLEESLFMVNHYIISNRIKVEKHFAPDIRPVPDFRLKLAFDNIIKNACEAMKDGGTLSITTQASGEIIEIIIKDTGPGISQEIQSKIFEPFFTTKKMGDGAGLGLAIAYEIVQRYQGEVFVESSAGEGASFLIRIPVPA